MAKEIIAANPSAEWLLGLPYKQMIGRSSMDPRWAAIREDYSIFPGNEHLVMLALNIGKPVTGVVMGIFHPPVEMYQWITIDAIPCFRALMKPNHIKCMQLLPTSQKPRTPLVNFSLQKRQPKPRTS
jgi:hypothetical protein